MALPGESELQLHAVNVLYIDWVLLWCGLLSLITGCIVIASENLYSNEQLDYAPFTQQRALLILILVGTMIFVINLTLNLILDRAISDRRPTKCCAWTFIRSVLLVVDFVVAITLLWFSHSFSTGFVVVYFLAHAIYWVYRVVSIQIVKRYAEELVGHDIVEAPIRMSTLRE